MNEQMHAGMLDATRLTRSGQLLEATARIQRTLRGLLGPDIGADSASLATDEPIEGTARVLDHGQFSTPGDPHIPYQIPHTSALRSRTPFSSPLQGVAAPAFGRAVPDPTPDVAPGAQFLAGSYTNAAGTRSYKLYVPSSYRGQALPLVVMLHGCTQNPDDFAAGTRMNNLAEEHRCFVLYPAQPAGANGQKCWNWFKATDQHRDRGEPSLIAGMTRKIIRTYSIDAQRVYVAGLSAGGAMAAILGTTYPDLYAAIGVHSGLACGVAHDLPSALAAMQRGGTAPSRWQAHAVDGIALPLRVVPTIVFHGDGDTTVHPRNSDEVIAQWISAYADGMAHPEAATKPKVRVEQGQVPDGHAYTRALYRDAGGQTVVEQWRVHGAGHAWSGGSPRGSYTDLKGPDATREMLRFFYQHPRPEAADGPCS